MPCPGIRHSMEVMDEGEPPGRRHAAGVLEGIQTTHENADEIHQVVAAKARAREKVPARTVRRRIFVMNKC